MSTLGSVLKTIGAGARLLPSDIGALFSQATTDVHDELEAFVAGLKAWAQQQNPEPIFRVLRAVDPIVRLKDLAIVTRFPDVQEVLARDDVFHVPYARNFERISEGRNFILGMENTPEYARDLATLRLAIRREDIPTRVAPFVTATAESIVAKSGGRIDVVKDLGDIVPSALVAEYVGTPSPEPRTFAVQSAAISGYLFLPSTPEIEAEAIAMAKGMRDVLRAQIAARKAEPRGRVDDVLERLLTMQAQGMDGLSDDDVLEKLFGIVVALIPTTSGAAARAIDELLRRPAELQRAQSAARVDDYATILQCILEALRFNPLGPGVFRIAAADYTLAAGTSRATTIAQGTRVLAALSSAMMDGTILSDPHDFRLDRPAWQYMHFGYGLHTCFGQYINMVQLPRILAPVLRRSNLRRADGGAGELALNGPFPASMTLCFDDARD